ncbi:tRNA (adenine(22)-N(1))-methyltransferase [Wansuia hejianensis]|uniref:SAM-dependent methyltransferase n=1 Tax=Wansuia hejianensis TaxID=2763667 RepID=A0A926F2E4_9FIRM|nr:class I SAM-dependent methyltransferase [Wansuia hejianensis]MBC8590752.1 SAM-dependent methyltransferase [Wansuia hejianensis]
MKLSKRLQEIADLVPKGSIVADIGTDHGYVPAYLIQNNISKLVIATDISEGSLEKTINYVKDKQLERKILTRLGDGLEVIKPFEVDTVIIAGMGGLLIGDILEKNKNVTDSITYFILQPMVASKELRQYLIDNKFIIIDEGLVKEDNKFYEIIFAMKGLDYIENHIYYEISQKLIDKNNPLLREFIQNKINISENIMKELKSKESSKSIEKYENLKRSVAIYREVLEKIEG